jgi:hypothetical protein
MDFLILLLQKGKKEKKEKKGWKEISINFLESQNWPPFSLNIKGGEGL